MYTRADCPNCEKDQPSRVEHCTSEDGKEYSELVCNHCHTVIATVYGNDDV